MYNYSFIIPHKNCPYLLNRCVDSIPVRDDVQIIVVDDNSDEDKKPALLERKGLEVVSLDASQSKGAGRARNKGVKKAEGKWLLFADADDLYTDKLSEFLDQYQNDNVTDIVYFNAEKLFESGQKGSFVSSYYIENFLNKKLYSEKVLRYGLWTPWTRMVKREMVECYKIHFEEIPTGNDMMFSLNCSKYAKNIAADNKVIYLYYTPENRSLTEISRKKLSNIPYRIELGKRQNRLYKEVGFIFRDSNISAYRNPPAGSDKKTYQKEYRKQMRLHKVNLLLDFLYLVVNRIGLMTGIIKGGI